MEKLMLFLNQRWCLLHMSVSVQLNIWHAYFCLFTVPFLF